MKPYHVDATDITPLIDLNHDNNRLVFEGESRPEEVSLFYAPVMEWLEDYRKHLYFVKDLSSSDIHVNCDFKLEYFNSSSAKYFMDIITKLNEMPEKVQININWHYEEQDEDMLEAGQEFEDMMDIKFKFVVM